MDKGSPFEAARVVMVRLVAVYGGGGGKFIYVDREVHVFFLSIDCFGGKRSPCTLIEFFGTG